MPTYSPQHEVRPFFQLRDPSSSSNHRRSCPLRHEPRNAHLHPRTQLRTPSTSSHVCPPTPASSLPAASSAWADSPWTERRPRWLLCATGLSFRLVCCAHTGAHRSLPQGCQSDSRHVCSSVRGCEAGSLFKLNRTIRQSSPYIISCRFTEDDICRTSQ
ncbi:hypothetical protein BC628DRAFT_1348188 [Trametes gibbosa]|nr:hypothetical protein BC628DRAFT_1348188 [Trametes gibbosa]